MKKSCPRKVVCVLKKIFDISAGSGAAVNDKKTIEVTKAGRGRIGRIISAVLILLALAFGAYSAGRSYSYVQRCKFCLRGGA